MAARTLALAALAALALTASRCGAGDAATPDATVDATTALDFAGSPDASDAPDAATPDAPDTATPDVDAPDEAGDVAAPDEGAGDATPEAAETAVVSCTREGFQVVSSTAETCLAAEGGFLNLVAADSFTAPADTFGLELLLDERTLGAYDFVDENYRTCERCLRLGAGCSNEGGCQKTFLVYAGRMDITAWEDPGGRFRATFTDLRAREVTISTELPLTSTPVEGGQTWCIDALSLDVGPLQTL